MGLFPKRTILVELGDLRPFSDISGRHTVRLNNTIERRNDLIQRLIAAQCKIVLSSNDWTKTGDFDSTIKTGDYKNILSILRWLHIVK